MIRSQNWLLVAMMFVMLVLSLPSCVSQQTGKSGLLKFTYAADDNLLDFNKAIAVGARLELAVTAVAGGKAATIQSAKSGGASLSVVGFSANKVTVESKGEGTSEIEVTARTSDGTTVTDAVDLRGAKALSLKLKPGCGGTGTDLYLTNRTIWIPYDLLGVNNTAVIGYGYHPVSIAPAAGLAVDATSTAQWAYVYHTGSSPGVVTLTSTLDQKAWSIKLVTEADIDGAKLDVPTNTLILTGTTGIVYARPTVGGQPLCMADTQFSVNATTPTICTVKAAAQTPTAATIDGWSFVEIKGLSVGVCKFDVTWQKAAGGQGVTQTLQVDVGAIQKP